MLTPGRRMATPEKPYVGSRLDPNRFRSFGARTVEQPKEEPKAAGKKAAKD